MDTQYCLQCEYSQTKYDQYGSRYCYCFFNPDKGRWVAEIKECPKARKEENNMIPDKIYLGIQDLGSGYVYGISLDDNEEQEYIRKDALIEWAKEKLSSLKDLLDTDPYKEAYIGKCEAFKEIVDKLNSM